jgi:hypothetical protein
MDAIQQARSDEPGRGRTRRRLIRKAAYSAPVVFAIAAAPQVALGKSGGGETVKLPLPKPPKLPLPPIPKG